MKLAILKHINGRVVILPCNDDFNSIEDIPNFEVFFDHFAVSTRNFFSDNSWSIKIADFVQYDFGSHHDQNCTIDIDKLNQEIDDQFAI